MASFVSLSGSMVMKSGVKFGRDGILSERKLQLVNSHHEGKDREKPSNIDDGAIVNVRQHRGQIRLSGME